MDKSVNIVGLGRHMKKNILPCLLELGVDIESITTRSKEKAQAEINYLGLTTYLYDDVDVMLRESKSDYVIIVVPMEEAYALVMKCLQANKKVFVEKPCGMSYTQAKNIYDCSIENSIPVFVGFMKRYAPCYQKMKEIIEQGNLGSVQSFDAHFNVDASAFCKTDKDFMYAVGIHFIDLLQHLFGEIKQVKILKNNAGQGTSYVLILRMNQGVVGTLSLENRAPWTRESEGITCTLDDGFIQSKELNEFVIHRNTDEENGWQTLSEMDTVYRENYTPASGTLKDVYLRGFMQELKQFFNDEIEVTNDNMKTTEIIENILEQLK
ncbi:Gfo/Idh/MocA family protein [Anaerorhabdus furcosa]|uniref:Predicted dehydrogenase n=1 Tax=Anaerorhabdus furcosa TaxID=118967 RepID=A0A1T4NPC0_9FIRM|nr:Gfo/Idh/MocA family oxidoreductase [Anaerorhabdus furcosa]SJZ80945.1 Predicted dehydrogenase [Anaerorhabdus furcosa]